MLDGCVSEGEHVFWIQSHTEENLLYGRGSEEEKEEEDSEAIYPHQACVTFTFPSLSLSLLSACLFPVSSLNRSLTPEPCLNYFPIFYGVDMLL